MSQATAAASGGSPGRNRNRQEPGAALEAQAPHYGPRVEQEAGEGGFKRGQPDTERDPEFSEPRWKKARKDADDSSDSDDSSPYDLKALASLIKGGDIEAVRAALAQDAGWLNFEMPGFFNRSGKKVSLTPLCIAAMYGHTELARELLAHGADFDQPSEPDHPLILAADYGHLEFVRMLLDQGADANWSDAKGIGALLAAARAKHTKVVELLLERGADPDQWSPQQWCNGSGQTALTVAIHNGDLPTAYALLVKGANPQFCGNGGNPPLVLAVGHPELIRRLFQAGAQFAHQGYGQRAMEAAIEAGCVESLQALFDNWTPAPDDECKASLLITAARFGQPKIVACLLKNGTPVDAMHEEGTAFLSAASNGHLDFAKELLKHGADPLAKTGDNNRTALHLAAVSGHFEFVKFLLQLGADASACDRDGLTPLHFASSLPIARLLQEKGGNLRAQSLKGQTCLMLAARRQAHELCTWLLDHGLPVDELDQDGKSALFYACEVNEFETDAGLKVSALLARGANPNLADERGATPLMMAAGNADFETVSSLLCGGADVNALNVDKTSALFHAAEMGSPEVVRKLLDFGARADLVNDFDETPLIIACNNGNAELVRLLLGTGLSVSTSQRGRECEIAMHFAAKLEDPGLLQLLHAAGADLSVRNEKDKSPIILAAREGRLETVRYLLQQEVDPDQLDNEKWSALHHACFMGHLALAELLLEHGASLELEEGSKETPFMLAAKGGELEVVNMLLKRQVHIQAVNEFNESALHLACKNGHLEVTRVLLERRIDPTVLSTKGMTAAEEAVAHDHLDLVKLVWPVLAQAKNAGAYAVHLLQCAASEGSLSVVRWLLDERIALANGIGPANDTGLHWACVGGSFDCAQELLERGADPSAQNQDGDTPLILAARHGGLKVLKMLLDEQDVDIHQRNTAGRNAIDAAIESGHLAVVERLLKEGAWPSVEGNTGEKGSYGVSAICVDLLTYHELLKAPAPTLEARRPIVQPLAWLMNLAHIQAKLGSKKVVIQLVGHEKFMNTLACSISKKLSSFESAVKAQAATTINAPAAVLVEASLPAMGSLKPVQWEQILSWTLTQLPQPIGELAGFDDLREKTRTTLTALYLAHAKTLNSAGLAGMQAFSERLAAKLKSMILESINVKGRVTSNELRKMLSKELALLEPIADLLVGFVEHVNKEVGASVPGISYRERFETGIESQLQPWSDRQDVSRNFFLNYGNHDVANMLFDQWHAVCATLGVQIPESAPLGPPEEGADSSDRGSSSK